MKERVTRLIGALLLALVFSACDREVQERPDFPTAELFTPQFMDVSSEPDTLMIVGSGLQGATVKLNELDLEQVALSSDGKELSVLVPAGRSDGEVKVFLSDGKIITFQNSLMTKGLRPKYASLLLGDFDGGGVRPAEEGQDFGSTQWFMNSASATQTGIGANVNGIPSISVSHAGGAFAGMFIEQNGIGEGTEGYVATMESRNELTNAAEPYFQNFFEIPGSQVPFPSEDLDIRDYYLKFFVNFNGKRSSRIRAFLVDERKTKPERFSFTIDHNSDWRVEEGNFCGTAIQNDDIYDSLGVWVEFVIPFVSMDVNYGFSNNVDMPNPCNSTPECRDYFEYFNKISFDVTDNYDAEDHIRFRTDTLPDGSIENKDVEVYIDNIELIYAKGSSANGAKLLDSPKEYDYTHKCGNIGRAWYQLHK